jgi:hypothetical protein
MKWRAAGSLLASVLFAAACSSGMSASPEPGGPVGVMSTPVPPVSPTPTPISTGAPAEPMIDNCQVFPSDNPWNTDISNYPVDPNSANYLASMNAATTNLHPDFGSNPTYGIPYMTVPGSQTKVPITFTLYGDQSDPGPYPIPSNAPIEGGANSTGDRHVIVIDRDNCILYEMYDSYYVGPGWDAGSGAIFHFNSDALRPDGWTSADAAGLPIFAGLVRYYEVQQGVINHALRFTVHQTQEGYIHPATHWASDSTNPNLPPMGLRVRLKASYDISHFTGESKVVLVALKKYGMFVADNGSDWYISGETNTNWNDNDLDQLKTVPASAFEVVETGAILH